MTPGDNPEAPAAAFVLKPEKLLEYLLIAERVIEATDKIPFCAEGPGPGQVTLLE